MERLTQHGIDYCAKCCASRDCCGFFKREVSSPCTDAAIYNRLSAYEDTGLEPEKIEKANKVIVSAFNLAANGGPNMLIERFKEIIQAESEGRLVVLSGIKNHANDIRQMSDEELADFIARQRFSVVNPIADKLGIDVTTAFIVGRKNVLDWLRQEAEGNA